MTENRDQKKAPAPSSQAGAAPLAGNSAPYLLSIDLEDIRTQTPDGRDRPSRVAEMGRRLLDYFEKKHVKGTFFVEGRTAETHPDLIREIARSGHEIGCHSHEHTPLDRMNPEAFREDLRRNLDALQLLEVGRIQGFRAPDFSLVPSTPWAWDVLAESGIRYSSSVLPARNPLYGWPGFTERPHRRENGLWELPISVTRVLGFKIPFAGGVYLRLFPRSLIMRFCRPYFAANAPLVGYLHPYDIDAREERFRVERNPLFNWLVYYNRKSTLPKLSSLLDRCQAMRFGDYVEFLEAEERSGETS